MKRTLSICILLLIILACVIAFLLSLNALFEQKGRGAEEIAATEQENSEMLESNLQLDSYKYILVAEDGQLVVYQSDNTTVYLETGIRTEDLTEEEKSRVEAGIRFQNEQELFDFLESYSS